MLSLAGVPEAFANPTGGQVVGGSATISSSGNTLTVQQTTSRAIINWASFDIAPGEITQFQQPSGNSIALNRVTGSQNPSQILGSLTANGQVWIVNPNGVLFGNGAQVNVGSLAVSTANISDSHFLAGQYVFDQPGNPNAAISNAGTITAADAGLVAFVAPNVVNTGLITARLGKVQLGSGDTFTLDLYGDGLVSLQASNAVTQQLVNNSGVIQANDGTVTLTAAAAANTVNSLINMDGVIQAESIGSQNGSIVLYAEGSKAVAGNDPTQKGLKSGSSTVLVSGLLDASGYGRGQTGGSISVLGDNVSILSHALLDASGDGGGGYIKIGGDFHGAGSTPTALHAYVDANSLILANANTSGGGGKVAVWSDGTTQFYGNILAEGGLTSGNGGFVETSGRDLIATGLVNAGATNGKGGAWLLDPNNIDIEQSSCTGTSCATADAIGAAISGGSDVTVTTTDGSITLGGTGNATITDSGSSNQTLTFNAGTDIVSGSGSTSGVITASGTGKLNVVFDSDTAAGGGAIVMNAGSSITSNGGNITLGGGANPLTTAAVGDAGNIVGVNLNDSSLVAAGGTITIRGAGYTGGVNTANAHGIEMQGGTTVSTTGAGAISLNGLGGGSDTGWPNFGIYLKDSGTAISVVNGNMSLTGVGGSNAASLANRGVELESSLLQTTGTGAITVTGLGGGTGASTSNYGVAQGGTIQSTATGGGSITVIGYGGDFGGSGFAEYGVSNSGSITSVDGDILIDGNTGIPGQPVTNAIGFNSTYPSQGLDLEGGTISATGNGNLTLNGVGGASGGTSLIYGIQFKGGTYSTANGNTVITGIGGNTTGTGDYGIYLNSSPQIYTTGAGSISLTGIGGNNATGILSLTGTSIGNGSQSGNITVSADTLSLTGTSIQSLQDVTFSPYTASTTIGVAGAAGTLGLTSAILDSVTASGITVGRGDGTGALTANAYSWNAPAMLLTGTGGITLNGVQTMGAHSFTARTAGGSDITIGASGGVTSSATGTAITLASGRNFINNAGSGALSVSSGRWLVYSTNPANDTIGGLIGAFRRYSCSYGGSCLSLPASGDGFLYSILSFSNLPATIQRVSVQNSPVVAPQVPSPSAPPVDVDSATLTPGELTLQPGNPNRWWNKIVKSQGE